MLDNTPKHGGWEQQQQRVPLAFWGQQGSAGSADSVPLVAVALTAGRASLTCGPQGTRTAPTVTEELVSQESREDAPGLSPPASEVTGHAGLAEAVREPSQCQGHPDPASPEGASENPHPSANLFKRRGRSDGPRGFLPHGPLAVLNPGPPSASSRGWGVGTTCRDPTPGEGGARPWQHPAGERREGEEEGCGHGRGEAPRLGSRSRGFCPAGIAWHASMGAPSPSHRSQLLSHGKGDVPRYVTQDAQQARGGPVGP